MRDIEHEAASRKGGRIRVDKGLARLPEDRRREIASMGGRKKHENIREGRVQAKESQGDIRELVDAILGDVG